MEIRNQFKSKTSVIKYNLCEYFGIYDVSSFEFRLKTLQRGAKLYFSNGLSFHQFQNLHANKRLLYRYVSIFILTFFSFFALLIYSLGATTFISLLLLISGIILHRIFSSPMIRANILHVNKLLADSSGLHNLKILISINSEDDFRFRQIAEQIMWESQLEDKPINGLNASQSNLSIHNCISQAEFLSDFQNELLWISRQENKFNHMPMDKVINFFVVLCCKSCGSEIPQLSPYDFIKFLKIGFLLHNHKEKLKFSEKKLMITYQIFHQFYITSYNQFYLAKNGSVEQYIRLLTDNFEGFEKEKVKNNFRTTDDRFLNKIREKYKNELHPLQPLQNLNMK